MTVEKTESISKESGATVILEDPERIIKRVAAACESSQKCLLFYTTQSSLKAGYSYLLDSYRRALGNQQSRLSRDGESSEKKRKRGQEGEEQYQGVTIKGFKWLVQIQDSSVAPILAELHDLGVELRHLDNTTLPFQFGISDGEEIFATFEASSAQDPGKVVSSVLFSRENAYVQQFERVFVELWGRATPYEEKIREIEEGRTPRRTEVVHGLENTLATSARVYSNAERTFCAVSDYNAPTLATRVDSYRNAYLDLKTRGVVVRAITEIVERNLPDCKELLSLGLVSELRHIENVRGNFAVTEKEYLAASTLKEGKGPPELIYSNDSEIVAQNQYVFDTLWSKAVPAELRIRQLEEGVEPEETRLIHDMDEVYKLSDSLIDNCREELLAILASKSVLDRNSEVIARLASAKAKNNFRMRILLSSPGDREKQDQMLSRYLPGAEWRRIDQPLNLTFFVFDHSAMFMTQYNDPEAKTMSLAVFSNIYTTNRQTIGAVTNIFEALWRESELRQAAELSKRKEETARRQAELLQDILSHDIRNYNQVAKLSAELIGEQVKDDDGETKSLVSGMLKALDGSTVLVEKTKKLGQILSQPNIKLYPVDLRKTIEGSISLVKDANPQKEITVDLKVSGGEPFVMADEFLSQVFENLISNSVKYTNEASVNLEVILSVEKIEGRDSDPNDGSAAKALRDNFSDPPTSFWKVSIIDHGKGIPDYLKSSIFARYLEGAKGSGLGLSIVYALARERYGGAVRVENRIEGDYTKGTSFSVWLPRHVLTKV